MEEAAVAAAAVEAVEVGVGEVAATMVVVASVALVGSQEERVVTTGETAVTAVLVVLEGATDGQAVADTPRAGCKVQRLCARESGETEVELPEKGWGVPWEEIQATVAAWAARVVALVLSLRCNGARNNKTTFLRGRLRNEAEYLSGAPRTIQSQSVPMRGSAWRNSQQKELGRAGKGRFARCCQSRQLESGQRLQQPHRWWHRRGNYCTATPPQATFRFRELLWAVDRRELLEPGFRCLCRSKLLEGPYLYTSHRRNPRWYCCTVSHLCKTTCSCRGRPKMSRGGHLYQNGGLEG